MANGWIRGITPGAWREATEQVTRWSDTLIEADLAYWVDRRDHTGARIPGRRVLQKRWRCTDWITRKHLRKIETNPRPTHDQPTANPAQTVKPEQIGANQPTTNPRPTQPPPHARFIQTQTTDTDKRDAPSVVYSHWRKWHSGTRQQISADRRRMLAARVKGGGWTEEQLVRMVTWAHDGGEGAFPYSTATKGQNSWETLFKPKGFETRVEKAEAWRPAPTAASKPANAKYVCPEYWSAKLLQDAESREWETVVYQFLRGEVALPDWWELTPWPERENMWRASEGLAPRAIRVGRILEGSR